MSKEMVVAVNVQNGVEAENKTGYTQPTYRTIPLEPGKPNCQHQQYIARLRNRIDGEEKTKIERSLSIELLQEILNLFFALFFLLRLQFF
jgi:hypothetical protein